MNIHDLERQIDVTRQELDRTLHALQDKLSPRRRLAAAWSATQRSGAGALRNTVDWAITHPMAVCALGATLVGALVLRPAARGRKARGR